MEKEIIYLDNAATTKMDLEISRKVNEILTTNGFGNPSSKHLLGRIAKEKIEKARNKIAKFINANPNEIFFTSGGTESNNWAIKGLAINENNKDKNEIITSTIEHPCILETCKSLEKRGYKIIYIKPNKEGIVNPKDIENLISKKTLLVSIMHANNEIGTIQPIEKFAKICKSKNIPFHTDAVQSFKKIPIDVKKMEIGMLSVSGHKVHAPKGIGFLYIKKELQDKISPIINGGGQERGMRSGTENTAGIIFLAEVLEIKEKAEQAKKVRDKIINEVLKIPEARLNGSKDNRLSSNINFSFYGIEGESLMLMLEEEGIILSTGSACSSNKLSHSHVLEEIQTDEMYINGSIRISLDTINPLTEKQTYFVIQKIKEKVEKLKNISPFKLNQGGKND